MNRASLASLFSVVLLALPTVSRAADPQEQTDPFAPPSEGKAPSIEEQEAAVLGAPAKTAPPAPQPAPRPAASARRQANDEGRTSAAAAVKESDQTGIAIEFSTSGFASGALVGGLFIGGRTASGVILGGFVDYGLTSAALNFPDNFEVRTASQLLRLGAGVRHTILQTADRRAELFGAADVSFDYRSAEMPGSGSTPTDTLSAAGFSLALGPGVRWWILDQVSLGYAARFRFLFLSGEAGVFTMPPVDVTTDGTLTQVGFDGVFQILAIF
jgi:hypothetical protein